MPRRDIEKSQYEVQSMSILYVKKNVSMQTQVYSEQTYK